MQRTKGSTVIAVGFVVTAFLCFAPAKARQTSTTRQSPAQQPTNSPMQDVNKYDPEASVHQKFEEQAAKARNSERFKRIQSDTEKLLKLSTELKEDVDKSTKDELSLDVIRKAAEVEKLAHDVKERMKG